MSSISSYNQVFNPIYVVSVKSTISGTSDQLPPEVIAHFEFDEENNKADLLKLTILDPTFSILDSGLLDPGTLLDFTFGHVGGHVRPMTTHIIYDLEPDFTGAGQPMFIVYAYDLSMGMGANYRPKNWGKVSPVTVASSIADANSLDFEGDFEIDSYRRDIMQPPTMSDMMFLLKLAAEINFVCYVRDGTLFFKKKAYGDDPGLELTYRNPDGSNDTGTLISFKPHMKLHNRPGSGSVSDGTEKQEVNPATSNQDTLTVLDSKLAVNNQSGLISQVKPDSGPGERHDPAPLGDPDRALLTKQSQLDMTNEKNVRGVAECIGDPLITKNLPIYFAGLGKRFSGMWYVNKVRHIITPGQNYKCHIDVNRQGFLGPSTAQMEKSDAPVNKDANATPSTLSFSNLSGLQVPGVGAGQLK